MKNLCIVLALIFQVVPALAVTVYQSRDGSIVGVQSNGDTWNIFDSEWSRSSRDFSGTASGDLVVFQYQNQIHAVTDSGKYWLLLDENYGPTYQHLSRSLGGAVVVFAARGLIQGVKANGEVWAITPSSNGSAAGRFRCHDFSGNAAGDPAVYHYCNQNWSVTKLGEVSKVQ